MGCDIHMYVERRENGTWKSADKWVPSEGGERPYTVKYRDQFYRIRNYRLFAMLADVRNGAGFAGIDTGDALRPIAMPRGLPDDVSAPVRAESDGWGIDGHSHSHLLLSEILAYDWTQTVAVRGWVNGVTYAQWIRYDRMHGELPDGFCGAVSGGSVEHIDETEMVSRIDALLKDTPFNERDKKLATLKRVYCQFEQPMAFYALTRSFWSDTVPRLLRLGAPEDVRIVFWFDN